MPKLTPEERVQRARIAALTLHSKVNSADHLAPARAKGPGSDDYWLDQVDPDHQLDDAERARRADCAKRAHFQRLAFKSAKARKKAS